MLNYNNDIIPEYKTTLEEVIENIDFYINSFKIDGILIFKKLNISEQQQINLLKKLGDLCNWYPNNTTDMYTRYTENHSHLLSISDEMINTGPQEILLNYHLECTNYLEPQHAAVWNMTNFKCAKGSGKTSFINSMYVLKQLPDEYIDFLRRSYVLHIHSGVYEPDKMHYPHKALPVHPLTNREILRIDYQPTISYQKLFSVDNQLPSKKDQLLFDKIIDLVRSVILEKSKSEDVWYSWDEGDVLVPDLLLMYHAVRGGFGFNEREFIGHWSFPAKEDSIEQFVDDKHLRAN